MLKVRVKIVARSQSNSNLKLWSRKLLMQDTKLELLRLSYNWHLKD